MRCEAVSHQSWRHNATSVITPPSSSLIAFRYDFIRYLAIDCLCTECHTFPTNRCRSINYLLADLGRWGLFIMCNHGLLCACKRRTQVAISTIPPAYAPLLLCYASGDLPRSKLFGRSFLDLFDLQEQLSGQRRYSLALNMTQFLIESGALSSYLSTSFWDGYPDVPSVAAWCR
jgi:hypothetical protein